MLGQHTAHMSTNSTVRFSPCVRVASKLFCCLYRNLQTLASYMRAEVQRSLQNLAPLSINVSNRERAPTWTMEHGPWSQLPQRTTSYSHILHLRLGLRALWTAGT